MLTLSLLTSTPSTLLFRPVASCGYGYGPGAPAVTGVAPSYGPVSGGTVVIITGLNFCGTSAVDFNAGIPAAAFTVVDSTDIQATSPAHAIAVVDVFVTNSYGISKAISSDQFVYRAGNPSVYTAMPPTRILDTRTSGTPLGPAGAVELPIGGVTVPSNATSVILNLTATDTTTAGYFTVYPTGGSPPTASAINWAAGQTIPNLVSVDLGLGGAVTIFNALGRADAVVDLEGYFAPPTGAGTSGQFQPLSPARITDTRNASGYPNAGTHLGPGASLDVQVSSYGGVPAGAVAVVMNVTVTNTTAASDLTIFPTGLSMPTASNLNWTAGVTIPNRVIVPLGIGTGNAGKITIYNFAGSTDVVIDVNGFFTDGTTPASVFSALPPARIMDTRSGLGGYGGMVGPGQTIFLAADNAGGVPASNSQNPPTAVVLNVTVTGATAASYLTLAPGFAGIPTASDLNFGPGQTIANLVVVEVGQGVVQIKNAFGYVYVVVDVEGWYS